MKLSAGLAALVALVVACAAPAESPKRPSGACNREFVVSPDFTDAEEAALQSAVDRWNEIAIEQLCLRPAFEGERAEAVDRGIFRIEHGGPYWQSLSEKHGGANLAGAHWPDTDRIALVDNLDVALFELVALHEFGHAHGLAHTAAPSIMHASAGSASDFTPNDLAECQRVGACRKEDSNGGE